MEAAALKREKENLFSHASTVYYYCKLSAALHTRLYGSSIETQVESWELSSWSNSADAAFAASGAVL